MIHEDDQQLIVAASDLLKERYAPNMHTVAAALRTKNGDIVTGLNIDHFSGFVCAETSALSKAINDSTYSFDTVVAVRMDDDSIPQVANMCGKCRQIFHDYAPGIRVIVANDDGVSAKTIEELLLYSFVRQQKKIQTVIQGGVGL
jgi:cytidine deaminase